VNQGGGSTRGSVNQGGLKTGGVGEPGGWENRGAVWTEGLTRGGVTAGARRLDAQPSCTGLGNAWQSVPTPRRQRSERHATQLSAPASHTVCSL